MATKPKKAKAAKPEIRAPRFAKWIEDVGVNKVAVELGVSRYAVYGWLRYAKGEPGGYRPDPDRLGPIVRLSAGTLTSADIYPEQK